VLGTAAYLAPEQARGEEAGPRADLYALGVVAYQLLSGRLPYEATSLSELAIKQQREAPIPLQQLNPSVPVALARAVDTALSIAPEQRPASALVFADAIRNGAAGGQAPVETASTRHLGTAQATRVLPSVEPRTAATRVVSSPAIARAPRSSPPPRSQPRARPREAPARRPAAAPVAQAAPAPVAARRSRGSVWARRAFALLMLMCVFGAAVVVAVVIATNASNTAVHWRRVITNDAQSAIRSVEHLIGQNTK
jgi:serine/threonine-protein kinase